MPPDSTGFYSNIFLVHKASGGWHSVTDLKRLNAYIFAPNFRMFIISSVLDAHIFAPNFRMFTISSVLITVRNTSKHPSIFGLLSKTKFINSEYLFQSEHSPSGVYSFGTHCGRLPPSSGDFGYSIPQGLVQHPDHQVLPCHQSQLLNTLDLVDFILNKKKS